MGGQKTVGQIYHEAVEQLKANYFQHVGLTGIYYSAMMLFSSVFYGFFLVFYFMMIFGMMLPAMSLPMAGYAANQGNGAAAAAAFLTPFLIMMLIFMVVFFILTLVMIVVMIATNTVQTSVQKAVLLLLKGDKLTWQAVWGDFKRNWKRYLGVSAWSTLWICLWSLLFFVPGIVKSYSYSLAPYLIIEYPDMTVRQALRKSIEITNGYKGKLFLITLIQYGFMMAASFLASFGLIYAQIAAMIVWIYPLYFAMLSIAYLDIKQAAIDKGLLPPESVSTVVAESSSNAEPDAEKVDASAQL